MAAIDEVLTGTNKSGVFTPSKPISEFNVSGNRGPEGDVKLIETTAGGSKIDLGSVEGSRSITTPDNGSTYQFLGQKLAGNVKVYMGP